MVSGLRVIDLLQAENSLSVAISSRMNEAARSFRWRFGGRRLSLCLIRLCVGVCSYAGRTLTNGSSQIQS